MAPNPTDADIHRELGKITAQLEEVLRRLDQHSENEDKVDVKMSMNEVRMETSFEKVNIRIAAIENRLNYGLGALAALIFIFELAMKLVKVA